jgi:hypothetical protein
MLLWHHLARAGMEAADEASTTEYERVREISQRRLIPLYAQHMRITRGYNELYLQQAELVGMLYDLYDRYSDWLENLEGHEDERTGVQTRLAELSLDLQVPEVVQPQITSYPEGYMAREVMTWSGSHPTGTYEHLFFVDQEERQFLMGLEALAGAFTGSGASELGGLTTNGPATTRTRFVLTPERGTTSIDRTARLAVRGGAGFYGMQQLSYRTVFTDDGTGIRRRATSTVDTDGSPPTTPSVGFAGHSGSGTFWFHDPDRIDLVWSSSDPQSGIAEYEYAIGDEDDPTSVREWTAAGGRTQLRLHGVPPLVGQEYRVSVRARNGQGLWSEVGQSAPFRYDPTPPTFGEGATLARTEVAAPAEVAAPSFAVLNRTALPICEPPLPPAGWGPGSRPRKSGSSSSQSSPEPISATFYRPEASDQESGVARYYWRVSTDGAATFEGPEGWTESSTSRSELEIRGAPLEYAKDLYMTVVAVNHAGLVSEPLVEKFRVADPTPPEAPRFCVTQIAGLQKGLAISLDRAAHDPETGITGYDYRIRTAGGTVVRDWATRRLPVNSLPLGELLPLTSSTTIRENQSYYVDLLARNGQGQETVVTSGPIRPDFSPPPTPVISGVEVRETPITAFVLGRWVDLGVDRKLIATVTVPNDPQSGIAEWAWEIRTNTGLRVLSVGEGEYLENREQFQKGQIEIRLDELGLTPGQVYTLMVMSVNQAGLTSKAAQVLFNHQGITTGADEIRDGFGRQQLPGIQW